MGAEREGKDQAAGIRNKCIKELRLAGVTRLNCMRYAEIRRKLQQRSIVEVVKKRREMCQAKEMKKTGSLVEKVMTGEGEGRRPREDLRSKGEMNSD